jgi:hypothetical protein
MQEVNGSTPLSSTFNSEAIGMRATRSLTLAIFLFAVLLAQPAPASTASPAVLSKLKNVVYYLKTAPDDTGAGLPFASFRRSSVSTDTRTGIAQLSLRNRISGEISVVTFRVFGSPADARREFANLKGSWPLPAASSTETDDGGTFDFDYGKEKYPFHVVTQYSRPLGEEAAVCRAVVGSSIVSATASMPFAGRSFSTSDPAFVGLRDKVADLVNVGIWYTPVPAP